MEEKTKGDREMKCTDCGRDIQLKGTGCACDEARRALREICGDIGCSGMSPTMCKETPESCSIIRKLVRIKKEVKWQSP